MVDLLAIVPVALGDCSLKISRFALWAVTLGVKSAGAW